jgi:DNA-binding response OmpR family regulator
MEQEKILVIEDEPKIADSLQLGLSEKGYHVDTAYDGKKGLEAFDSKKYDLILLDINLPSINGYDLCKIFRVKNPEVPIIILTSLIELEDRIFGYDLGADDYLVKPFEFKELLLKIKVFLKRTSLKDLPPRMLKAGDLEMDLDRKEVRRGNKLISLTAKEFQLLEFLLMNKNKVVARHEIAVNVWEIDFDTNTNVIDVYINYLRNKVDKPFEQKLIQTQVGMGYILKEN